MPVQTKVILFDLGGVLADLRDPVSSMELDLADDEFWRIWLGSSTVRDFETGKLSVEVFAPKIATELGVKNRVDFEHRLRSWELRPFPKVERLVDSLHKTYRLALLSNTNEMHWAQIVARTKVFEKFDDIFLSFRTGHYKPHRETFEYAVREIGCGSGDVLFLDDSDANVVAARGVGIVAERVVGPEQVERALMKHFCIPQTASSEYAVGHK